MIALGVVLCGSVPSAVADHSVFAHLSTGPAGGNGPHSVVTPFKVTPDGDHVFFQTTEQLTSDDTDNARDIYRLSGGGLARVSTGPAGGNAAEQHAFLDGITPDGQTIVFNTREQLTSADTDTTIDLYKRIGSTTTLVSIGPNGENGPCIAFTSLPAGACNRFKGISDDGRHILFESGGHLVSGDEEAVSCRWEEPGDFADYDCVDGYDSFDGVTSLVTSGPTDPHSTVDYFLAGTSSDGKAFFNAAESLTPDDNAGTDVYQWFEGSLSVATVDASSTSTVFLAVSDDGDRMFYDDGSDIWEATSGADVLRTPGTSLDTTCCALFTGGISGDGDHVYFATHEPLVPEDTDSPTCFDPPQCRDIYEQTSAGYQLVSSGMTTPNYAQSHLFDAAIPSGDKAYFRTGEPLSAQDTDARFDLYEFDSSTGTTRLVSTGPTDPGEFSNNSVTFVGASEDGARVFFTTDNGLISQDTNGSSDIYESFGGVTWIISDSPNTVHSGVALGGFPSNTMHVIPDGSKVFFTAGQPLIPSDTDTRSDLYMVWHGDTAATYARPKGATPFHAFLVPAFLPCTAPNRTHGPPLAFDSCSPALLRSGFVTLGTSDGTPTQGRSIGSVKLKTLPGAPGGADDTDIQVLFSLTNVLWQVGLSDYTGELQTRVGVRLTDRDGSGLAGTTAFTFSFDAPCAASPDPLGATCSLATTADALVPGLAPERTRAIWEIGDIEVLDGGEDGDVSTFHPQESGVVAVDGVFVP